MPAPVALKVGVHVLFVGLLGSAWWLDHRFTHTGVAGAEAGPDAQARFGFRLQEVAHDVGVDFVHRPAHLDPLIANIEPDVAGMGAAVSVADVDADGWPDFYATTSALGAPNALYVHQPDGRFRD